jgi:uncharacterized membrane protein
MFGFLAPDTLTNSFLIGLILGVIPLFFSTGRDRLKLGFGGLLACLAGSFWLGVLLAVPLCGLFLWLIFRQSTPVPFEVQAKNRRLVITVMSVLGIVVAGYLSWSHFSGEPVYCGGSNSCELVNNSRYAFLGPFPVVGQIPVSLIGLIGYVVILGLSLVAWKSEHPWPMLLIFGGALIGTMLQWYLFYIEVAVLRAICYWCVTSQTLITLIFLLSFPRQDPAAEEAEADQAEA